MYLNRRSKIVYRTSFVVRVASIAFPSARCWAAATDDGHWDFFLCSLSFCFIVDMAFTEPNSIFAVTWTRRGGMAGGLSPTPPPADVDPYPPHAPFKHLVGPLLFTSPPPPADRVGEPSGTLVLDDPFDIWKTERDKINLIYMHIWFTGTDGYRKKITCSLKSPVFGVDGEFWWFFPSKSNYHAHTTVTIIIWVLRGFWSIFKKNVLLPNKYTRKS